MQGPDVQILILELRETNRLLHQLVRASNSIFTGVTNMATQLDTLISQVNDATNTIAGKLDAQSAVIKTDADAVTALVALLQSQGVPQASLDALTAIAGRLGGAAGVVDAQTAALTAIGADASNPVPPPAPAPAPTPTP